MIEQVEVRLKVYGRVILRSGKEAIQVRHGRIERIPKRV
jgi:hypothetical protein